LVETRNFSTYIIPGACDFPNFECVAVHLPESSGPGGLKGVGEIAIDAPAAAVANAVADACGWHCPDFPLTAERLLMALSRNPGPENPAEQFKEGGQ